MDELRVGTSVPITRPVPIFYTRGKPKPEPNLVEAGFPRQFRMGSGGYLRVWVMLPCLAHTPKKFYEIAGTLGVSEDKEDTVFLRIGVKVWKTQELGGLNWVFKNKS